MKEKTNTKEHTPLFKCIFKGMVLENQSANPSGMLGSNSGNALKQVFNICASKLVKNDETLWKLYKTLEKNCVNVGNLIKTKMYVQPGFLLAIINAPINMSC